MEQWKNIDGLDGYQISNHGNVLGKRGKILSGSIDKKGYIVIRLYDRTIKPHRLVAAAFVPNPEGKPEVNHIDGNKQNNRADNLEWVTRKENMAHASKNDLIRNAGKPSKITAKQAEEIKSSSMTQQELADVYGVSQATISRIKNGLTNKFCI